MHPRRALMYVPGDDEQKLRKAAVLTVDCLCLDLEDGVAANRKDAARVEIARALSELTFVSGERLVRLNAWDTGRTQADLAAILPAHPQGVVLPKVQGAQDLLRLDALLAEAETNYGWAANSLALIALIESARGFINLKEICAATPRLQALIFGAEDYANDVGALRTPAAMELFTARGLLVMHAAAFGLQAIDMVTVEFREMEVLTQAARQGAELGFSGKQVIHPGQVAAVQAAFTPSAAEIDRARTLLLQAAQAQQAGAGAFDLNGQMVDMPVIRQAQNILARAQAAGLD